MNYRLIKAALAAVITCCIFAQPLLGQIKADFDFVYGNGQSPACIPVTVSFNNSSTGSISEYSWTLNGAFFSSDPNPIRSFVDPGEYNVCLTISNASENDQICKIVPVYGPSEINLAPAPSASCDPNEVTITATIVNSIVELDSIFWDFGDGNTTTVQANGQSDAQTHRYPSQGNYTVTILVKDANDCQTSMTVTDLVSINPAYTVDFAADPQTGCFAPLDVNFTNNSTADPDVTFEWDFGDGASSTEISPSHIYANPGAYTVTLIGTNTVTGCVFQEVKTNYISIGQDLAAFNTEIIEDGDCSTTQVRFTLATANISSATWNFGDGNTSTEINPTYTYTNKGCFIPSVSITTSDGCSDSRVASECIEANGTVTATYLVQGGTTSCDVANGHPVNFIGIAPEANSFEWDFGGEGTSTEQNPSFTFTNPGSFPITMRVNYDNGCQQSVTLQTIVLQGIEPDFTSNYRDGCAPLPVSFENRTNTSETITSYAWDFGFTTSTEENPTITFPDAATYDVSLKITTSSGCSGIIQKEGYIDLGEKHDLNFVATPTSTCVDTLVRFINNSPNEIEIWEWDFGDGGTSDLREPEHEYQDTGKFDVRLIAFDHGCRDTLLIEEMIHIAPPIASFNYGQVCGGTKTIEFRDTSIGADSWLWTFGDGTTSTDQHPIHTYAEFGQYNVSLTVTNDSVGCSHSTGASFVLSEKAIPVFSLPENQICIGDTIQISNTSTNAVRYDWGYPAAYVALLSTSGSDPEPKLFFPRSGAFTGFSLTVTDGNGCTTTYELSDTVYVSEPVADFNISQPTGCSVFTVDFTEMSSTTFGGVITEYLWDFGDGNTSSQANPTHEYQSSGSYGVSLTVTNEWGCSHTKFVPDAVVVDLPVAGFNFNYSDCTGADVGFNNSSTSMNTVSYLWDFGDGQTSTETNPTHTFPDQDSFVVCLTATNPWGCTDTYCDTVGIAPPIPGFEGDKLYKSCPNPPLLTNFTDLSIGAVAWEWDFGDGSGVSNLQSPTHAYSRAGSYTVCLTITNQYGCQATECKPSYINVDGPSGVFDYDSIGGCVPLDVNFTASGNNIVEYSWDFGDGTGKIVFNNTGNEAIAHSYTQMGHYFPVLIIKDESGCKVPLVAIEPIVVEHIALDFNASDTVFCEGSVSPVSFISIISDPNIITSTSWTLAGASPATSDSRDALNINYSDAGSFAVTFQAASNYCQEELTKEDYIVIHPKPEAEFGFVPTDDGCVPESFQFQDSSTIAWGSIDSWSWVSGNGLTSTDQNPVFSYDNSGNYNVRLEVVSDQGCRDTYTETLEALEGISIDAGTGDFICQGESVQLNSIIQGTSSANYSWSPAATLSCTDCPNPVANPIVTTTYYLSVGSPEGCGAIDSVVVEVSEYSLPDVQLTKDTAICRGEVIQLMATGGIDPFAYQWDVSRPGLSCYEHCYNPIVETDLSMTYVVSVTGEGGCVSIDSVRVTVLGEGAEILGEDRSICKGSSVNLPVLEGTNPIWKPAGTLSCANCDDPIATPPNTTTYTVDVNFDNCVISDQVTVTVLTADDIDAGPDTSICIGTTARLRGRYSGESTWEANGLVIASNEPSPLVSPDVPTFYILTVEDDLCTLMDSVKVEILEKVEITGGSYDICEGESIQVEVTGNATNYSWSPAEGLSASNIADPIASPEATTVYEVTGTAGQCQAGTAEVTVTVHTISTPNLPGVIKFGPGGEVDLDATVPRDNNYTYLWSPGRNLSCATCPRTIATPDTSTSYTVEILDVDHGCESTESVYLQMILDCDEESVIIPTAFTPNNDGNNDVFYIRGSAEITTFKIYDRWGALIFETDSGDNGWDGNYLGSPVNRGVFVYYVEGVCRLDGSTFVRTGDITLLR